MTSFITHAKYVHDVESDLSYVEMIYDRYTTENGYETYTDYINTQPLADWTSLESKKRSIPYDKFLDTMVEKTLEVYQRMAELKLENILSYEQDERVYVRLANAAKILDPIFQPPRVNMESAWQMELIKKVCKKYIPHAIQVCFKKSRLEYFFNVLCTIEREQ
jgi:hypothetical protein